MFDIDERVELIKAQPGADRNGMILAHEGIVRRTSKTGEPVSGMDLDVDRRRFGEALTEAAGWDGVVAVDGWMNDGRLAVGGDIMKVVVAGDVRGNVLSALQRLVALIKNEVVSESELH